MGGRKCRVSHEEGWRDQSTLHTWERTALKNGMVEWEAGNAEYLMNKVGAQLVTPRTFASQVMTSVMNSTAPGWKMTVSTRSPAEVEARSIWTIVAPILVALCCGLCICLLAIASCMKYNKGCSLPEAQEQDEQDLLSDMT